MRVISGKFKGKKILEPRDIKTRPLKDLTKESRIYLFRKCMLKTLYLHIPII